ncbi:MAG: right-handed parallel beta-helix repeat-containing protein [Thermoplasmata archaeon]|nr:MAG: right-handed parallel beta-helix repeat-containing protein [Thermoplasmata archaeon]
MNRRASTLKQSVYPIIIFICLFNTLSSFLSNSIADGTGDYPAPIQGDWIIANDTYVSDEIIIINGNLTVVENATLTLDNVVLIMNSSRGGITGIEVDGGSRLNIYDSNITANRHAYYFAVWGNMTMERSTISRIAGGIFTYFGDVYIANSTVFDSTEYGIICYGTAVIFNNTIHSNYGGVVSFSGSPLLYNNTITKNEIGVSCLWGGYVTLIGNEISNNTSSGIIGEWVYMDVRNNTIASNDGFGIWGHGAKINATNNQIYGNSKWGIYSLDIRADHNDNIFEKDGRRNGAGNVLLEWEIFIQIYNSKNDPVDGVNLTIWDQHGKMVWSNETLNNFRVVRLREYEIDSSNTEIIYTPFIFRTAKGFMSNYTTVDISDKKPITLILDSQPASSRPKTELPYWGRMVIWGIWLFILLLVVVRMITVKIKKKS